MLKFALAVASVVYYNLGGLRFMLAGLGVGGNFHDFGWYRMAALGPMLSCLVNRPKPALQGYLSDFEAEHHGQSSSQFHATANPGSHAMENDSARYPRTIVCFAIVMLGTGVERYTLLLI